MAKKGPLKKVIREFGVAERLIHGTMVKGPWLMEELECGHIIRKPSDLHGEYDAVRRRCVQCAAAQQVRAADIDPLCPECHCELHLTTAGDHVCRNEACGSYR